MARFYSNENFPLATVRLLREMGHDVLTTWEAGNSDQAIPDDEVLRYATSAGRCVLTLNRLDFIKLHKKDKSHAGIIVCTTDGDFRRQATKIAEQIHHRDDFSGELLRVYRGN